MSSTAQRLFTPVEAEALSGVTAKAINSIIDKRLIPLEADTALDAVTRPTAGRAGRQSRKFLTGEDLVRIMIYWAAGRELAPDARRSVVTALAAEPRSKVIKASEFLSFDVQAVRKHVDVRVKALAKADALVHADDKTLGGEPVFKGTRIPVHAIADMLNGGADVEDLKSGYPTLTEPMLEAAPLWAAAHPRRGRPRKSVSTTMTSSRRVAVKPDPLRLSK